MPNQMRLGLPDAVSKPQMHAFHRLLDEHFFRGTTPAGKPATKSGRWTNQYFSGRVRASEFTVSGWRNGRTFPTIANFHRILLLFFGEHYQQNAEARELVDAYNKQGPYFIALSDLFSSINEAATIQIPAAYRFGTIDGKIDAVPVDSDTADSADREALYGELKAKLDMLLERLKRSNIDPYVLFATQRLLDALGRALNDIRPGLVLSRMRTIEAVHDAFGRDDGRESLFPDAVAMMDDACLTGRDFLATFPVVRQIERQRLALGIERSADRLEQIRGEANAVQTAAASSEVVATGAVEALTTTDPDILRAKSVDQVADLLGDKLLVIRNFVSATVRSVKELGASTAVDTWKVVGPDFQEGARTGARMLVPLALITLATSLAGPIAGLAGLLRGDVFKPLLSAVQKIEEVKRKNSDDKGDNRK
jgi:hypothetical protein